MSRFHLIGYPLLFIAALEIYVGVVLLRQNPRDSPINRSVAAFSLFSAAFSLFTALMYLRAGAGLDYAFVTRATWIGWFSVPAALQFLYYLRDEKSRAARLIGYFLYPAWTFIYLLCLFTNLIVVRYESLIPFKADHGPLEYPARLFGGLLIIWVLYETVSLRRRVKGNKLAQLNYFFIGTIIFGFGGAMTAAFLQLFAGAAFDPALASYFSMAWVLLTVYAIARHSLFDIRLFIAHTLAGALFFTVFALFQLAAFFVIEPTLGRAPAAVLSLAIVTFLFFQMPFKERVRDWVDRLILRNRYEYQRLLREAITAFVTILDLDGLLDFIINALEKHMGARNVRLLLSVPDGSYSLHGGAGDMAEKIRTTPAPASVIGQSLIRGGGALIRQELEGAFLDRESGDVVAAMRELGAELVLPLRYRERLHGMLILGDKRNGEPYVQSDLELLDALAGHAVVAIENARLYEESGRVKESLVRSEARFRNLVETTNDWIWEVDEKGTFTYVSPTVRDILGYTPEEILGKTPFDLMTREDAARTGAFFRSMVRERKAYRVFQNTYLHQNGLLVVIETSGVPIFGADGAFQGYRGINRDVTERKRLEDTLRHAQKMEALGRLASGVAHDIGNIVTAIVGYATVMQMELTKDDPMQGKIKQILATTDRAANLTRSLTEFSRKQEMRLNPLKLGDLLREMDDLLEELVKGGVKLTRRGVNGDIMVMADSTQMERVIMNLVVNARDAMPEGGEITIETGPGRVDADFVKAHGFGKVGAYGVITVRDTGMGMDDAVKARIFEPCFTTKPRGKGSGLGLAIAYSIIKDHKGYIMVDSAPGAGSSFTIYLPAVSL